MHLSKSQYIKGLQCHKALWLSKHRPELIPQVDAQKQHMFDTGHEVGELAKHLFPGGTEIAFDRGNFQGMIAKTAEAIENGADVIYEASFRAHDVFIMADILVRNGSAWDLYEVKASTRVKPYHENDAAIQSYVLSSRIPVGRVHIVHVNTDYIFDGALNVHQLFTIVDVSETVAELADSIAANLASIAAMLDREEPEIPIGLQCSDPYDCDFKSYCWKSVPYPSVFELYRLGGKEKFDLYHRGLVTYADVQGMPMTQVQELQVKTGLSGAPHIDAERIREFISSAEYPINFLDFETFSSAVPKFEGQQPYKAIPFQYSLHVLHADCEPEHREFLADGRSDPRLELTEHLLNDITPTGTIVAFNKGFEQSVIKSLSTVLRQHESRLLEMNERFIDLIEPFRKLMYYDPDFNGSFSIKSILPALFPGEEALDYKKLEVQGGEMAMIAYASLGHAENDAERQNIRESLIAYCKLDTLAMVRIWRKLDAIAAQARH